MTQKKSPLDFRELPREDMLSITDVAYYNISRLRPVEAKDQPLRVVAKISLQVKRMPAET